MKRVEKTHLPVAALTHPGMKGKNNEDRFGVSAFRMGNRPGAPVLLAVLSDGIGGNRAGEVASELAVNIISQYAANSEGETPTRILESAILYASQTIQEQALANPEQHGMGATCACAWITGDRLYTATVGDSRIYLMRDNSIRQLSIDHTWIQEAIERGLLQPDQVNGHPNAHVIRRYLGSPTPPEVDLRIRLDGEDSEPAVQSSQGLLLQPGDIVLLCSDGLTDLVSGEEILETYQQASLETAGQQLIDLANQRGGHDNITLVAIQVPDPLAGGATIPKRVVKPGFPRSLIAGCILVVALATVIGGLAGGWILYSGRNGQTPTPTIAATLTGSPAPSRTITPTRPVLQATPTTAPLPTGTPTAPVSPDFSPSLTPWRVNSPTPGGPTQPLLVVTVSR